MYVLDKICSTNYGSSKYKELCARSFKWSDYDVNATITDYYKNTTYADFGKWSSAQIHSGTYIVPGIWSEFESNDPLNNTLQPYLPKTLGGKTYLGRAFNNYSYYTGSYRTNSGMSGNDLTYCGLIEEARTVLFSYNSDQNDTYASWISTRYSYPYGSTAGSGSYWGLYFITRHWYSGTGMAYFDCRNRWSTIT